MSSSTMVWITGLVLCVFSMIFWILGTGTDDHSLIFLSGLVNSIAWIAILKWIKGR